tara:strand:+ start:78 stop:794 length:717 start_codon:yes stop_codon:yes gene_type:complete
MRKFVIFIFTLVIFSTLISAATLQGTIYNEQLEVENDVVIEIDTVPAQKYLSQDGTYSFELNIGNYNLIAQKGFYVISEEVEIISEGEFVFDLFLLPGFVDEDDLWQDTNEQLFTEEKNKEYGNWRYWLAGLILLILLWRIVRVRKKWGSLRKFRRKHKAEAKKTVAEHKEELAEEPGYIDEALTIIKKNDGRITQRKLRQEMLHLSEAKVSLILTELEHKGKIEKVKKGRGNVILLK